MLMEEAAKRWLIPATNCIETTRKFKMHNGGCTVHIGSEGDHNVSCFLKTHSSTKISCLTLRWYDLFCLLWTKTWKSGALQYNFSFTKLFCSDSISHSQENGSLTKFYLLHTFWPSNLILFHKINLGGFRLIWILSDCQESKTQVTISIGEYWRVGKKTYLGFQVGHQLL